MPLKTRRPAPRSERGAVAVIVAALATILLVVAALGVDLASQVQRKHLLINQLDSASTAAAFELGSDGSIADSVAAAQAYFAANGLGALDLHDIDFWCVVARKLDGNNQPLATPMAADYQIPTTASGGGTCNPDAASSSTLWHQSEYQNRRRAWDGRRFSMTCSRTLCAIPCALQAGPGNSWNPGNSLANNRAITCNTIRVGAEQDVPFSFAPVMGIDEGSTGSQVSVACAGSCGEVAPNPLDVVVVADRTLSMTTPLGCTLNGSTSSCSRDYRQDLVSGIQSMLQVMTPEQQYVALGALGPSEYARANSESRACNTSSRGLVFPGANASTSSGGSWVPVSFKKDYLSNANSSGVRGLNTSSRLVSAIDCLDAVNSTGEQRLANTRTALASPLKSAARYVLGIGSDANNIASLGGADRSGEVQKVIIFETDGEPWEAASTTNGAISLNNGDDIFSNYTDYTTSLSSATTSTGSSTNGTPRNVSPSPPSPYNGDAQYPATYRSNNTNYNYTYNYQIRTSTRTETWTETGGQNACSNFLEVARQAKAAGILIITIGYNLGGVMCSGENDSPNQPSTQTSTGTPWISGVTPAACRGSGAGTASSPYQINTSCNRNITVSYTVPQDRRLYAVATGPNDRAVTDVLASASGGNDKPTGATSGCNGSANIASENADEDLFFCAARGDDLAPLFVTALGSVTGGVKLIRLP